MFGQYVNNVINKELNMAHSADDKKDMVDFISQPGTKRIKEMAVEDKEENKEKLTIKRCFKSIMYKLNIG